MIRKFVEYAGGKLGQIIPEGKIKGCLRHFFQNIHEYSIRNDNPLYKLDKIICKAELTSDNLLSVELENGSSFSGPPDKTIHFLFKHAELKKLGKLRAFEYYGDFLNMLYEQYIDGSYEKYYRLEKGSIVIDVGANIGIFTVMSAQKVGDEGKVIAIEPEGDNLKLLRRNIDENRLNNVTIVPKGLWSSRSKMKLFLASSAIAHSLSKHNSDDTQNGKDFQEIEVDTLDNILGNLSVKQSDFIKMDIEGAEIEALKGMTGILRNAEHLAISAYHPVDGKPAYNTVVPLLEREGFRTRTVNGVVYAKKKKA